MIEVIDLKSAAIEDIDNWLLTVLDQDELPFEDILSLFAGRPTKGEREKRREWADLVQDALAERGAGAELISLLQARVSWNPEQPGDRDAYLALLTRSIKDRLQLACVESAFEGNQSAKVCLQRLNTLVRLKEGTYCCDRTWGFGIVKRMDDFYKKATINFLKKPNHQMSFAYAGETLEVIDKAHLLARRQDDPDDMRRITAEEPHVLVRIALESYGDLTNTQLQEILTEESFVEEGKWKSFWDAARRGLKNDSLVDVPAKRSEPIRLLSEAKAYDRKWFANMAKERDAKRIYELVEELEREGVIKDLDEASRDSIGERLAFAVLGAEDADPTLCVKVVLLADRHGFVGAEEGGYVRPHVVATRLAAKKRFVPACAGLAARDLHLFFKLLSDHAFVELPDILLEHIGDMPVQMLNEALAYLCSAGDEQRERARAGIKASFSLKSTPPQVLYWLCMNLELYKTWQISQISDLYLQVITCFETQATHDRLKAQKLLKGLFEDRDWLSASLGLIDDRARAHLMIRVRNARGWEEASRRSVMGKMIKLYPELEQSAAESTPQASGVPKGHFTSWRSYRERQAQLKELVEVAIPENSKEIGVAISYGDLRENFEYQAAKDMQGLLMRRKAELERDLVEVRGTDFADATTDAVMRGTSVDVQLADGRTHSVAILGEWDRDEALNIVSNESELAKRLLGKQVGDTATIPFEEQEHDCSISAIHLLSAEIMAWASRE